jgi:hypothetical protein
VDGIVTLSNHYKPLICEIHKNYNAEVLIEKVLSEWYKCRIFAKELTVSDIMAQGFIMPTLLSHCAQIAPYCLCHTCFNLKL